MNQRRRSDTAILALILVAGLLCIEVAATVVTLPAVFANYVPHSISQPDIQASEWLLNNSPQGSKVGVFGFDFWDYWVQYYSQRPAIQAAEGVRYLLPDSTSAEDEQQGQLLTQVAYGRYSVENGVVKASDSFYTSVGRPIIFLNLGEYQDMLTVNDSQVLVGLAGTGKLSGMDRIVPPSVPLSGDMYSIPNTTVESAMQTEYSGVYFEGTKSVTLNENDVFIDYKLTSNSTIDRLSWLYWKIGLGPMLQIEPFQWNLPNRTAIYPTLLSNETGSSHSLKINLNGPGVPNLYFSSGARGEFGVNLTSINANSLDFRVTISFNGPYYGTAATSSFSDSCSALNELGLNYVYIRTQIYPQRYKPILNYLASSPLFSQAYPTNPSNQSSPIRNGIIYKVIIYKVSTEKCATGS